MFEKEAEEYLDTESKYLIEDNEGNIINIANKVKQAFKDGAEPREKQIAELSKHIVELQNDKGELIDRCRELEAQIEKMKSPLNCKHSKENGFCMKGNGYCICDKWELED